MIEIDWDWLPEKVKFDPVHLVDEPRRGLQRVQYGSPYWAFEMSFDKRSEEQRKAAAAVLARSEGLMVFNVYDPRTPLPGKFGEMRGSWSLVDSTPIPALRVKSVSRSNQAILVQGEVGDVITTGDPLEFTHQGLRHYYCSSQDLVLDGTEQSLDVYLRPRVDIASLDLVINRRRPRQRFVIDMKSIGMMTDVDRRTDFKLKGIEFHGLIT